MSNRLRVIEEVEQPAPAPAPAAPPKADQAISSAAVSMLTLALKALSQRTLIALSHLFTLLTVATVFWTWMAVLEGITLQQIAACSVYSLFVLAINRWGRK